MYDLQRFIEAQKHCFEDACLELKHGKKKTHWMWFIFPQLKGLGQSETSQYYGLCGLDEAQAYINHDLLYSRLVKVTDLVLLHRQTSVDAIFGYPDTLKFHSCMTLFAALPSADSIFQRALDAFFAGRPDDQTLLKM